jgi:zinc protease
MLVIMLASLSAEAVDKQTPPAGGPAKPFVVPSHEDFTLENGLKVTLVPYGSVPKVTVDVIVRSGSINEESNQV